MGNIWSGRLYYMFGFLFLCYALMVVTCAAVTVLLVYLLLCSENYHWQWRAFGTAGASAGYVFANAMLYWMSKLSLGSFTSGVLYVGYSALISFLFFILTGEFAALSLLLTLLTLPQAQLASSQAGRLYIGYTGPLKSIEIPYTARKAQTYIIGLAIPRWEILDFCMGVPSGYHVK